MKTTTLLLALAMGTLGIGCATMDTDLVSPPQVDPQAEFRRQEAELDEANYDALCARPDIDQATSSWCMRRQQIKADLMAQTERERAYQSAEADRQRREEREKRQDRLDAINKVFAPWHSQPAPVYVPTTTPIVRKPTNCTSYLIGSTISTNCN